MAYVKLTRKQRRLAAPSRNFIVKHEILVDRETGKLFHARWKPYRSEARALKRAWQAERSQRKKEAKANV